MRRPVRLVPAGIGLALAAMAVLATPTVASAVPIVYSVTGSVSSESGTVADVTGQMLISSEAWGDLTPPFNTNSMVFYDIEQYNITLGGLGAVSGTGELTIEYAGPTWGQFIGEPTSFSVRFFHADGSPYPRAAEDDTVYPLYFELPPMMTFRGVYFSSHEAGGDLTLTQVAEPGSLLLLGSGLVGLAFARKRR